MTTTTVAYLRRSTSGQTSSIERQKEQISKYADHNDLQIDNFAIEEALSGTTPLAGRPVLLSTINKLKRGDTLLALNVSRLARDEVVFYEVLGLLAKRGINLQFADGSNNANPMNKLLTGILVLIASAERQAIADRTRQSLALLRSQGRALGNPSRVRYGYRAEYGYLVEDPKEQKVIEQSKRLRALGVSYQKIAISLTERGYMNRLGKPFSKHTIRQIFVHIDRDRKCA
jgi:DNA invertase Pin-like site-specific DNA recombinase